MNNYMGEVIHMNNYMERSFILVIVLTRSVIWKTIKAKIIVTIYT